jgi:hypothetical protein
MAKAKAELHREAVNAGMVAADSSPDDYTGAQLETLLGGNVPEWEGTVSAREPLVAPDGHVNLSQEDIDARDQGS